MRACVCVGEVKGEQAVDQSTVGQEGGLKMFKTFFCLHLYYLTTCTTILKGHFTSPMVYSLIFP